MEWVEITGRTVDEAKEAALDQLGVDTDDAEFEILEEPSKGLFGRVKGQARVRARIAPTRPRPKVERRDRRGRKGGRGGSGGGRQDRSSKGDTKRSSTAAPTTEAPESAPAPATGGDRTEAAASSNGNRSRKGGKGANAAKEATTMTDTVDVDLAEHTRIVTEFLDGLVDAFDLEGRVEFGAIDDETNEVRIDGRDLGLLVGPKGNTLAAIQELSRTVVHRKVSGTAAGRVRLDVGGYRARRREALEPMGSADRKVVHDTVNDLDGVGTISEGEEPRRRVVIVPA